MISHRLTNHPKFPGFQPGMLVMLRNRNDLYRITKYPDLPTLAWHKESYTNAEDAAEDLLQLNDAATQGILLQWLAKDILALTLFLGMTQAYSYGPGGNFGDHLAEAILRVWSKDV